VTTKPTWEEQMPLTNKRSHEPISQDQAPVELRDLALLELKRRRLLKDLADVESQRRQLLREIKLTGIPIPWLDKA